MLKVTGSHIHCKSAIISETVHFYYRPLIGSAIWCTNGTISDDQITLKVNLDIARFLNCNFCTVVQHLSTAADEQSLYDSYVFV